jgi:hypothetical protein
MFPLGDGGVAWLTGGKRTPVDRDVVTAARRYLLLFLTVALLNDGLVWALRCWHSVTLLAPGVGCSVRRNHSAVYTPHLLPLLLAVLPPFVRDLQRLSRTFRRMESLNGGVTFRGYVCGMGGSVLPATPLLVLLLLLRHYRPSATSTCSSLPLRYNV